MINKTQERSKVENTQLLEDAGGSDNGFSVEAGGGGNDVGMSMAEVAAKLLGAGKAASKSRLAEILKAYLL